MKQEIKVDMKINTRMGNILFSEVTLSIYGGQHSQEWHYNTRWVRMDPTDGQIQELYFPEFVEHLK